VRVGAGGRVHWRRRQHKQGLPGLAACRPLQCKRQSPVGSEETPAQPACLAASPRTCLSSWATRRQPSPSRCCITSSSTIRLLQEGGYVKYVAKEGNDQVAAGGEWVRYVGVGVDSGVACVSACVCVVWDGGGVLRSRSGGTGWAATGAAREGLVGSSKGAMPWTGAGCRGRGGGLDVRGARARPRSMG
jgi:hypothetical protein